jgi:hypothetical protein
LSYENKLGIWFSNYKRINTERNCVLHSISMYKTFNYLFNKEQGMKKIKLKNGIIPLFFFVISVSFSSFRNEAIKKSEAEKVKTVVVLGNSLVLHSPSPEIGWYGDWGMAASVRDSDFVHLLIRDIHEKDTSVVVKFMNIADFERGFDSYHMSILDSVRNPDMLIMKISENVNDKKALEDNFISYYDKLVKYIAPKDRSIKVIVDGFWVNKNVNRLIEEYAIKNNYLFVTTTSLSKDSINTAKGKFKHEGVAAHPSDEGMRMIEQRIWDYIKDYF